MASASLVDDDDKAQLSSQSKDAVSEDFEDGVTFSQAEQAISGQDIYDSDSDDSDCSVTSGLNNSQSATVAFFMEKPVGYSTADESEETTWTDEKHSSYLDSMEASFVQKMYDKEYCSMDVCGHSSHSSFTLDQECVESQPLCLNIRKPLERKVAGLLTFRAPTRPLPLLPIMMTSPWIQHFKSQRNRSLQNARFQDKDAEPLNAKEIQKKDLRTSSHSSSSEHGPESSYGSAYKKREFAKVTQSSEYKKQRCQHFALSHMDILMEQQYNEEQHRKMGETDDIEDGQMEPNLVTGFKQKEAASNCKNVGLLENTVLKEKQELAMGSTDIEPCPGRYCGWSIVTKARSGSSIHPKCR
ncbi:hypothetical protein GOP47_0016156 [Adiantum capillus-veneris]|uniref:Uncharacterized protein n=1 Tax=Adiantum capillus-veneris TaxID=13818 RepID=A0A9D4UL11_ADICA|nr:hypothetical protein GOP47_0016156 [Adiantum capillus-veneris]